VHEGHDVVWGQGGIEPGEMRRVSGAGLSLRLIL
jgi:hypothetical protein